uniref:Reverse transcriptase domain-containing protein n=1 Tax=Schistosoma curassoni TaxID=6186 RepID=A0A183KTN1_9TREM
LGSIIDEQGGSDADVKARIGKARAASGTQNNWQPTPRSEFSVQMSRQFYCLLGRKPGELRKPSSKKYRCLLAVVYAKYFGSVGRTLLATTNCGREQTRFQRRKKLGRSAESG